MEFEFCIFLYILLSYYIQFNSIVELGFLIGVITGLWDHAWVAVSDAGYFYAGVSLIIFRMT